MILGIVFLLFGIYTIIGGIDHLNSESMEVYEKGAFFVLGAIFTYSGASRILKPFLSPIKKSALQDEFLQEEQNSRKNY